MGFNNNNKKIAKNTIYLYIRTIIVMVAMLYTSRIVLLALGAEDLGIYNVVGGVVALMSFFQATLTKATSRFLTYELGCKSGDEKLQRVFSISLTIHILIVLLVIIIGETLGIYVLQNWTTIPANRQFAALCVYQCSLFIFCVHLLRVPYNATLIAHENMSVYAYMSILEASLQLLLAFILLRYNGDKLIAYGFLMLCITILVFLIYYFFVRNSYKQYRYKFTWDKNYSTHILTFSGWTLIGSSTNVATQQGVNLLFNNFIGLVANTALGFANQVNGAVSTFVGNFTTAFNPQIIKLCAQHDYQKLHVLMNRASKFSFVLMWIMALPLIFNMDFVLHIWLKDVPQYTVEFCQMILVCSIIDATTGVYNTAITATGNIRLYQIYISMSFLLDLLFAYLLLKLNLQPVLVFGSRIFTRGFLNMLIGWRFIQIQVNFDIIKHLKQVLLPIVITIIFCVSCLLVINNLLTDWTHLFISCIITFISTCFCTYFFILDSYEKNKIIQLIKQNIK